MSLPPQLPNDTDFLDAFRNAAEHYEVLPPAQLWAGIEAAAPVPCAKVAAAQTGGTVAALWPKRALQWAAALALLAVSMVGVRQYLPGDVHPASGALATAAHHMPAAPSHGMVIDRDAVGKQVLAQLASDFAAEMPAEQASAATAEAACQQTATLAAPMPRLPYPTAAATPHAATRVERDRSCSVGRSKGAGIATPDLLADSLRFAQDLLKAASPAAHPAMVSEARVIDVTSLRDATVAVANKLLDRSPVVDVRQEKTGAKHKTAISFSGLGLKVSGQYYR